MSVSSSGMLCSDVGVKESPSFSMSISDRKIKELLDSLELTEETRSEIKLQNQNKRKNDEESTLVTQ